MFSTLSGVDRSLTFVGASLLACTAGSMVFALRAFAVQEDLAALILSLVAFLSGAAALRLLQAPGEESR